MRVAVWLLAMFQLALALGFARRLLSTLNDERITGCKRSGSRPAAAVLLPVLNERDRLEPCLHGLMSQGPRVREIVVVDGGSTDGTPDLVRSYQRRDSRIRLNEVDRIPDGWNGKAWGLEAGLRSNASECTWVVTVDADVRCHEGAIDTVIDFAESRGVDVLSVACDQAAPSTGLSLVHPSLLATLVYRFGIPGSTASDLASVQSNGQFGVYRRDALERAGGFTMARDSLCEDVTLARHLYLLGEDVGFYEGPGLATTEMYSSATECLTNWPRSLTLTDRLMPLAGVHGLANVLFLQMLPLLLWARTPQVIRDNPLALWLNRILAGVRFGILFGTRRAYADARWTYWLSPIFDPASALLYLASLARRRHTWRGRVLVRDSVRAPDTATKGFTSL
jgi:dolichol-phosphate mannosyltransferase